MFELLSKILKTLDYGDKAFFYLSTLARIFLSFLDVIGVVILGLSVALLSGAKISPSSFTGIVFNLLGINEDKKSFTIFSLLMIAYFISKSIISLITSKVIAKKIATLETKYAVIAFKNWLQSPIMPEPAIDMSFVQRTLIQSIQKVYGLGIYFYTSAIGEASIIFTILATLILINPMYFLILLVYLACVSLLSLGVTMRKIKVQAKLNENASVRSMDVIRTANFVKPDVYYSRTFSYWIKKFESDRLGISSSEMELQLIGTYPRHIIETALMLGASVILIFLGISSPNSTQMVQLTIFVAATFRIFASVLPLQGALTAIRQIKDASEDAIKMILWEQESKQDIQKGINLGGFAAEATDLTFKHSSSSDPLFENLNFQLLPGQQLLISGKSGIGKSTLLELLVGIRKASAGKILIHGQEPDYVFMNDYRKIAYVKQNPYIFDGTVCENIAFATYQNADADKLRFALAFTGLEDFVYGLPNGVQTRLGNDVNFSSGQEHRLGLARAIYQNPDFLILDEPFNALDYSSAQMIAKHINSLAGKTTVVVVTHVHSSLLEWDLKIELAQGRLPVVKFPNTRKPFKGK